MLKKLLSVILVIFMVTLFIPPDTQAQTNATTRFSAGEVFQDPNDKSRGSSYVVEWEFTLDSLAGLWSKPFTVPGYDGTAWNTYPVSFSRKTASTYSAANYVDIFVQGYFKTTSDTTSLDTIAYRALTESDSSGVLHFNGSNGLIHTRGVGYRLFARSLAADVHEGKVVLVFTRREND